jgi:spoIIIJ-associated protein
MNPYERRIIHSALQGEKYVTTYSEGEEPYRKVIVALKKDENGEDLLKEDFESGRGRNGRRGNRRDRRGGRDNRRDKRRSKENNAPREEVMDVQAEVEAVISEMDTDSVG